MDREAIDKAIEEAGEIDMNDDGRLDESSQEEQEQNLDANTPDNSSDQDSDDPSSEDANTPKEKDEENVPFHEHPRFKELSKERRELKDQLQEMQSKYDQMIGRLDQLNAQKEDPTKPELSAEQLQAKEQLIDMLGLRGITDSVKALQEENQRLTKAQTDQAFDAEEKKLIGKIKEYGLAKDSDGADEVLDNIQNHIKKHPVLSKMENQPGIWELAFNDLYINRAAELGERKQSKAEIERQQKIKGSKTESTSRSSSVKDMKLSGNALNDFIALADKAGGIDSVDMNS